MPEHDEEQAGRGLMSFTKIPKVLITDRIRDGKFFKKPTYIIKLIRM